MNNKNPQIVNTDYKRYIYKLGNFFGARLKYETTEFKNYTKIIIDGFTINYIRYDDYIDFSVDNQLIRKIKLKSLNKQIKNNSVEDKIFRLLELSEPYIDIDESSDDIYYSYKYNIINYDYNYDYNKTELRDQRRYQKYQSKQINYKIKNYKK